MPTPGDSSIGLIIRLVRVIAYDPRAAVQVATVRVDGAAQARWPVPSFLGRADDLRGSRVDIAARRRVVFTQNPAKAQFFVNGKLFAHGNGGKPVPMFSPRLNTVEE